MNDYFYSFEWCVGTENDSNVATWRWNPFVDKRLEELSNEENQ